MIQSIIPKLPMRDKSATIDFYQSIGFDNISKDDYEGYLILQRDDQELHFFLFKELNPLENYGMVYIRTKDIQGLYQSFIDSKVPIHPNGSLQEKPWGQMEFSIVDCDNNLLTFGLSLQ